jgi:hypothetical protein
MEETMSAVFKKLNLKNQTEILILNAPSSFEPELAALKGITILRSEHKAKEIAFSLAFVTQQKEIDTLAKTIARKAAGDAVVWFAYPKGTLVGQTLPTRRIHQEHDARQGLGDDEPRQEKVWAELIAHGDVRLCRASSQASAAARSRNTSESRPWCSPSVEYMRPIPNCSSVKQTIATGPRGPCAWVSRSTPARNARSAPADAEVAVVRWS